MKRLPHIKDLTRLTVLAKPMRVKDIDADVTEEYEDRWLIKAEKIETKRMRAWRQQLAG